MPSTYEFIVSMKDQVSGAASSAASALTGMLGPASAVIAALGAVTGAASVVGGALFEGGKMALEASRAKREMVEAFAAFGGGEKAGQATLDMIRSLEKEVPESEGQLATWAKKLEAAGTTDLSKLHDQLTAVAAAQALIPGAGAKALAMIQKLQVQAPGAKLKFNAAKLAGVGVTEEELLAQLGMTPKAFELAKKQGKVTGAQLADAITSVLKTKGQPALQAAALDLGTQWGKLKDNVQRLFEDVNPMPFLQAVHKLIDFGGAGGSVFKYLKQTVTTVFNTLFSAASKVLPYVRQFLLGLAIGAVKFWISLRPALQAIGQLFSTIHLGGGGTMQFMVRLGAVVGETAAEFVNLVVTVVRAVAAVVDFGERAYTAAKDFIAGLVNGITSGATMVADAAKGVAKGAIDGFKNMLGIHSPSQVMAGMGANMAAGLQQGIDDNARGPQSAMLDLAAPPRPAASSGGGDSGGITVGQIGPFYGVKDGEHAGELVKVAVADMFEQLRLSQGG